MTNARTLFLAPQLPWPLDVGSKIRTFNLLQCYAALGPVTLVCFADSSDELGELAGLGRHLPGTRLVVLRRERTGAAGGRMRVLVEAANPVPGSIRRSVPAHFLQTVAAIARADFDIVHTQRLAMADVMLRLGSAQRMFGACFRILDLDDIESRKADRSARLEPIGSKRKYLHLLESLKLRAYEKRAIRLFDRCLVCSSVDADEIATRVPGAAMRVFPNGADIGGTGEAANDDGRTLTFLGTMKYSPNEDAVLFFAREVLPLVRRRVPDAKLVVAGGSPSAEVRALDDGDAVRVLGYVEDKAATLAAATALVVPLRIGGGTRIKILEAMAAGTPVVSTTIGKEGIDAINGRHLLVADDARSMAAACVSLLLKPDLRQSLARAGRALVREKYDWDDIRRNYVAFLRNLLSAKQCPMTGI